MNIMLWILTACQYEIAFMIVQRVESKLHSFANDSDVTPENMPLVYSIIIEGAIGYKMVMNCKWYFNWAATYLTL